MLLSETHGNLHDIVEFLVVDRDLFKIMASATIALFGHLFSSMVHITFIANIIDDMASPLSCLSLILTVSISYTMAPYRTL